MKSIIEKIKNLIPYFILISIYFFFINLEASNKINKDKLDKSDFESKKGTNQTKTGSENSKKTIEIPVIPFEESSF